MRRRRGLSGREVAVAVLVVCAALLIPLACLLALGAALLRAL